MKPGLVLLITFSCLFAVRSLYIWNSQSLRRIELLQRLLRPELEPVLLIALSTSMYRF